MPAQQPTMRPIYRLIMNVGTFRDYSPYTAPGCIDMVWFRSYHKYPKKIGGYRSVQYLKSVIDSTGGYGIPRKILNIINDNKNSVITTGDAYKNPSLSTYPVSGVAIANSANVTTLGNFIDVFLPNSLPAVPALNNNMVWTVATTSSVDHSFNDIVYDGVTYVGVDMSTNDLFWATDPLGTWTRVTNIEAQTYSSMVVKIVQGKWVLLVTYTTTPPSMAATKVYRIYTSDDGRTWTPQSVLSPFVFSDINPLLGAAIYAANRFIVVGSLAAGWSEDGATYNNVLITQGYNWKQIAATPTGDIICAVGSLGATMVAAVSTDSGSSWTISTIRTNNPDQYVSICYANGYFIAITSSGLCSRSTNGTTWTAGGALPVPSGSSAFGMASDGTYALCTFVGTNQSAVTRDMGVTWTLYTTTSGSYTISYSGVVSYVNGNFFSLMAPNSGVWDLLLLDVTSNGLGAYPYPLPISASISGERITNLAYANGRYAIAVSNSNAVYYSPNLTTWTRATAAQAALNWSAFIGANNRFLLVASSQSSGGCFSMSIDANTWNQLPSQNQDGQLNNNQQMTLPSGLYQLYVSSNTLQKNLQLVSIATGVYNADVGSSIAVLGGGNNYLGLSYSSNLNANISPSNITTGLSILIKNNGDNTFYAAFSESSKPTQGGVLYYSVNGQQWSTCLDESGSPANIGTVSTTCKIGQNYVIGTSLGLFYSGNGIIIKKVTYGTGTITSPVLSSHSVGESGLVGCAKTPDLKMTIYNSTNGSLWTDAADQSVINVSNYPMIFVGYYDAHWVVGIGRNSLGTKGTVMTSPTTIVAAQGDLPAVSNIFTPGEYVWNLDAVTLTSGQETVAASTYIVAQPSCGSFKSIADNTDYYVFIRNLGSMQDDEKVALRFTTPTTPATELKNWMVPMIQGQNINPQPTLVEAANIMNSTVKVSGGICAVGPFMFAYGNNGLIRNSDVNNPSAWFSLTDQASVYRNSGLANDVNVGTSKIVKGLPYRGMGTKYAALFWSLDSLILATFVGAPSVFDYTIISNSVTILAAHSAIEVYGSYYWIGDNRFYVYAAGQIIEVPNEINRNWFFTNINPERQHITWASVNPQYNEIWWFFPKGNSYECNHALIYNYIDKTWYDTPITRGAGFYAGVYNHPLWASNVVNATYNGYDFNLHEIGVNAVNYLGTVSAISSSITTPDIGVTSSAAVASLKNPSGALQNWTQVIRIEPDGQSVGNWSVDVIGTKWARGTVTNTTSYPNAITSTTEHFDFREQWRMMYLKFYNSEINGDWYMGNTLISANIGDCEGI